MNEAGLIVGRDHPTKGQRQFYIERLTWNGHAFLANAKNKTVWEKLKKVGDCVGSFSLDTAKLMLASIALDAVSAAVKNGG
jgi:hypothetical protein